MVDTLTVGGVVVGLIILAGVASWLRGDSDTKYDDPDAQAAHERAQKRQPDDVAPVGSEHTTVVQEMTDGGSTARVSIQGLYVFVEDVPSDVGVNDTVEIKITDHGPDGNSGRARYLGRN